MQENENLKNWTECWKKTAKRTEFSSDESRMAEMWNKRSDTFGVSRRDDKENKGEIRHKRTDNIFAMLNNAGFKPKGAKVLDIGCGPGTLAIPLAKAGADVTAVDIASGMLDRLKKTTNDENLSIDARELSWWTADIDELGFRNKYDLVLASMTPGINGVESFEKMMACSKRLCYYSNFVKRGENPAHDELRKLLAKEKEEKYENRGPAPGHSHGPGNGLIFPFMYLYLAGYRPDVRIINSEHRMEKKWEEAADRTIEMMSRNETLDEDSKEVIRNYYKYASENGFYCPKSITYTGMMVWNVNK